MTLASCCGLIEALKDTFDTNAYWAALTVAFIVSPMEGSSLQQGVLRMLGTHFSTATPTDSLID